MRKLLALLCLLASPAAAQTAKTPTALQADIASTFRTGCVGCINPASVTTVLNNITVSYPSIIASANTVKCNPTGSQANAQDCANPSVAGITLSPSGSNLALSTVQNLTGSSSTGPVSVNQIAINSDQFAETATGPASFVNGFYVQHLFGGASMAGGRQALSVLAQMTAPAGGATNNRNYAAGLFEVFAQSADGGTSGAPQGAFFALNPVAILGANQSFPIELAGTEIDVSARTGSGLKYKVGNSVVQLSDDAVQGTTFDAAFMVSSQTGASTVWKNGFQFSNANGQQGVGAGSKLFSSSGSATVNSFIDFSSFTCSGGNEINFTGLTADCSGNLTTPGLIAASTAVTIKAPLLDLTTNAVALRAVTAANGAVATAFSGVGPTGSHTSIQKWLVFQDSTAATFYVPAF